jgi:tRNA pseudouridine38-40 synthase
LVEFFNNKYKIVLVVEYDGSQYFGFQWQANVPTIQSELEKAIYKLTRESLRVMAASRTDTGVHARHQVISFWTVSTLSPQTFVDALNYYLPKDIAVKAGCYVDSGFNVRRDAVSREYEYRILISPNRSPLMDRYHHHVFHELNIDRMNEACGLLKGEHNFTSFCTALSDERGTVRTVTEARVVRENNVAIFHMAANSFLPHQVRNTIGLLIRIGLDRVTVEEFNTIIEAMKVGLAGPTAPPHALCLIKVNYPDSVELKL